MNKRLQNEINKNKIHINYALFSEGIHLITGHCLQNTATQSVRLLANKSISSLRNVQKHSEPNRTGLDLTLTCQVLTDCRSIHSLTRKASYCQGTARYNGEREKNWRWKSIKLAPSSPLNSRTGGRQTRASFEGTVCLWGAIWAAPRRERLVLINLGKKKKRRVWSLQISSKN